MRLTPRVDRLPTRQVLICNFPLKSVLLYLRNIVSRYAANFMPLLSAKLVLRLSVEVLLFVNVSYFKSIRPYADVLDANWEWFSRFYSELLCRMVENNISRRRIYWCRGHKDSPTFPLFTGKLYLTKLGCTSCGQYCLLSLHFGTLAHVVLVWRGYQRHKLIYVCCLKYWSKELGLTTFRSGFEKNRS